MNELEELQSELLLRKELHEKAITKPPEKPRKKPDIPRVDSLRVGKIPAPSEFSPRKTGTQRTSPRTNGSYTQASDKKAQSTRFVPSYLRLSRSKASHKGSKFK